MRKYFTSVFVPAAMFFILTLGCAGEAWFVIDGRLASFDVADKSAGAKIVDQKAERYFGVQPETDKIVLGLGALKMAPNDEVLEGMNLALYEPVSKKVDVIAKDIVRAYPAPSGNAIAVLPKTFSLQIYMNGKLQETGIKEKVLQVAWFHGGKRFVYAAYPSDWSPEKMSSPKNQEELLRLTNADLHIYDLEENKSSPLVIHPELDYNPVVSPDGQSVIFVSTRTHYASFYKVDVETGKIEQLTNFEPEKNRDDLVPAPLLDKIMWPYDSKFIIYETNSKNLTPQIRSIGTDGKNPQLITTGKHARWLGDGFIAYLDNEKQPRVIQISTKQ